MGRSKNDCAPCKTGRKDHGRSHHAPKNDPPCAKCEEPECDCRCVEKKELPLSVVEANFTPVADSPIGVFASARINLSEDPKYRPPMEVCRRRQVNVRINANLQGGTLPQVIKARVGVFYDTGPNDFYIYDQSSSFVVPAGEEVTFTTVLRGDLDKDRILIVQLQYLTETTPPLGAGVELVPQTAPATDIAVSIYYSKKFPAKHNKQQVVTLNVE